MDSSYLYKRYMASMEAAAAAKDCASRCCHLELAVRYLALSDEIERIGEIRRLGRVMVTDCGKNHLFLRDLLRGEITLRAAEKSPPILRRGRGNHEEYSYIRA